VAKLHFVEDYERLVAELTATLPLDEAMARAVGGDYQRVGQVQYAALRHFGLHDGHCLIDLGCGSGRLAAALGQRMQISYLGIDIVQALLDYAASKAPPDYRFVLHRDLHIPAPDACADMVCAFSVFTHLLHTETYLYLQDIRRVLLPGGRLVFSFLEFGDPEHWPVFAATVAAYRTGTLPHLNQYVERSVIDLWCEKLGYVREMFVDGSAAPWGDAGPLWQSVAVLRRP
jgi:ubiquinone/menaquinone biosynthesis C-methylase UbiE